MSHESDKYVWVEGQSPPLNPYEPSAEAIVPMQKDEGALSTSFAPFPRTVLVWSLVCGISACLDLFGDT